PPPTPPYILSLHDALPIYVESAAITSLNVSLARSYQKECSSATPRSKRRCASARHDVGNVTRPSASRCPPCSWTACAGSPAAARDRKSTRLNSSHDQISYA